MLWVRICVSAWSAFCAYMCCLPWWGAVRWGKVLFAIWYPNEFPGSVWARHASSKDWLCIWSSIKYIQGLAKLYLQEEPEKLTYKQRIYIYKLSSVSTFVRAAQNVQLNLVVNILYCWANKLSLSHSPLPYYCDSAWPWKPKFLGEGEGKGESRGLGICDLQHQFNWGQTE